MKASLFGAPADLRYRTVEIDIILFVADGERPVRRRGAGPDVSRIVFRRLMMNDPHIDAPRAVELQFQIFACHVLLTNRRFLHPGITPGFTQEEWRPMVFRHIFAGLLP